MDSIHVVALCSTAISIGSLVTQIFCLRALSRCVWYSKQNAISVEESRWSLHDIKNIVSPDSNSPKCSCKAGRTVKLVVTLEGDDAEDSLPACITPDPRSSLE